MLFRFALALFILLSVVGSSFAQQRSILFEEIQKKPKKKTGEWIIGGKTFTAEAGKDFGERTYADVGNLVVVEYYTKSGKSFITEFQPQPIKAADIFDGPYVIWKDETTAEVITMRAGKVERETIDVSEPKTIENLKPLMPKIKLDSKSPETGKSEWDTPSRTMVISDLEGNYQNAIRFLQSNSVITKDGSWNWGDGHLVLVGDLVDRGQAVTEVMWLVKRLEREAQAAGGQVHYVLGNHEAMVMAGDIRYIHPKYHFVTERIGIPYEQLFGTDSEIGRWWRTRNSVVRVGDLLFVHGGYSPQLDEGKLSFDELNELVRKGLAPAKPTGTTASTNPVAHNHGPFWYRGYFKKHAANWGGQASPQQIQKILDRHGAKHVVVGHTVVEQVGPIDETGLVIGVDVKWADSKKCEGLLHEDGKLYRVMMSGKRSEIESRSVVPN
jgi:UDP-2,3-diacylglucosamine pyrophosphatase LpxH